MTQSKPRKTAKKPAVTKMCLHCNQVRNLSDFYSNRDWIDQGGKDIWCKKCISQIKTKDDMREYFWENHRKWDERIWNNAQKKAELQAAKNVVYQKSPEDRRNVILEALTCQQIPSIMQIHYAYVDNSQDINANDYQEAKEAGKIIEMKVDPNVKTYNAFFNGDFKQSELEYLENFYDELSNDFDLSDISLRDNAKKLAKAALTVDKMQNDYLAGRCQIQDLNNAVSSYNLLASMGNFAASKRKPGDKAGMNSWSEISFYCESHGYPMTRKIEWPKDDVDKTIDEFRHIVEALDLNGA